MTFKILNNNERLKTTTGIKVVIFGPYGTGKTSLLKTISEPTLVLTLKQVCLLFKVGREILLVFVLGIKLGILPA